MAKTTPLSMGQLTTFTHEVVQASKAGTTDKTFDLASIFDLTVKISRMVTLTQDFKTEKYRDFDGDVIAAGGGIEEYFIDLIMPTDYDELGADTLSPADPTHRPVTYSKSLPRKKIKVTERFNDLYQAVYSMAEAESIINRVLTRWTQSRDVYKFQIARQALGNFIAKVTDAVDNAAVWSASTAYSTLGTMVKSAATNPVYGVIYKTITANQYANWAAAVAAGAIVVNSLVEVLPKPSDTESGENFIESMGNLIETVSEPNNENLNGSLIGTPPTVDLFVIKGVIPNIKVKTLSGAFHRDDLEIDAKLISVNSFGEGVPDDVYAVALDPRGLKVHMQFQNVLSQVNADGDFQNFVWHYAPIVYESPNAFIHVYRTGASA